MSAEPLCQSEDPQELLVLSLPPSSVGTFQGRGRVKDGVEGVNQGEKR